MGKKRKYPDNDKDNYLEERIRRLKTKFEKHERKLERLKRRCKYNPIFTDLSLQIL